MTVSLDTFRTPQGLYEFMMPFGLSGAPATFQRLMDELLEGFEEFARAYIDIHTSGSWEDHLKHVEWVLRRLEQIKGVEV